MIAGFRYGELVVLAESKKEAIKCLRKAGFKRVSKNKLQDATGFITYLKKVQLNTVYESTRFTRYTEK